MKVDDLDPSADIEGEEDSMPTGHQPAGVMRVMFDPASIITTTPANDPDAAIAALASAVGRIVHFMNQCQCGETWPAIITRVHTAEVVNLQVFLDGWNDVVTDPGGMTEGGPSRWARGP